jgi:transposase
MTCSSTGLSHVQLTQLRGVLKEEGLGKQGRSRSATDNARALLHIAVHQQHGLSYDAAIKAAAQAELASPSTLRAAVQQFATHGALPIPSTAHRGRGNPVHPLHSPSEPSLEAEILIHRRLEAVKERNLYESSTTLRASLRFELGIDVSQRTMLRWLHELGYIYGHKRFVGAVKPACRFARMRSFIRQYAVALRAQQDGEAVVVDTDESYVLSRHCGHMLWYSPSSATQNEVQGDDSGGLRLMIVHALTRDGMLETPGAVATNLLTERVPTAELIFETLGADSIDYHSAMDGDRFLLWLRNRLLPAFEARYPGKRMYLVLDNATYHHIHGDDWITPSQMSVTECVSFLQHHRVNSITVERDGVRCTFAAATFGQRDKKKAPAPTRPELQAAVRSHLESHPELNRTEVEKLMTAAGHTLVYTPPFAPEVQPIELAWALAKQLVARQATTNRSIETTREQAEAALSSITTEHCRSFIACAHAAIERFMRGEAADSLGQHASLQALVDSLPAAGDQVVPMQLD